MSGLIHCERCGKVQQATGWRCDGCGMRSGDGWAADLALLATGLSVAAWVWYESGHRNMLLRAFVIAGEKLRPWLRETIGHVLAIGGHPAVGLALLLVLAGAAFLHSRPARHRPLWWLAASLTLLSIVHLLAIGITEALLIPNWYGILKHKP